MQESGIETSVLTDIIGGRKTIEGRLAMPKFLKLSEDDRLRVREDPWKDDQITQSFPDVVVGDYQNIIF